MMLRWLRRLRYFLQRRRIDEELREEMALHIDLRTAELVEQGLSHDEARRIAERRFGNTLRLRERSRTVWGLESLEAGFQDLRYALRTMGRAKAFTTVVVLSMAVGIGANVAVFSVANETLLRTLPVPDPDELVLLRWVSSTKKVPGALWGRLDDSETGGYTSTSFVFSTFEAFRERTDVFQELFAFKRVRGRASVVVDDEAELATAQVVSGGYYRGLGVRPMLGRTISEQDDRPESALVAVISHGYWQRRFGADPDVVGRQVSLNAQPVTIVGVTPPGFVGALEVGELAELSLPLATLGRVMPSAARWLSEASNRWWVIMMGRLAPGVSRQQAEAALGPAFAAVVDELPEGDPATMRLQAEPGGRGLTDERGEVGQRLAIMAGVTGLVLLIACANIASLLLSRGASRRREIAVRAAIGAGRRRLLRQLLSESLLLSGLGAAAGLVLARWLSSALLGAMELDKVGAVGLDWRVVGFTLVLGVGSGLAFGLAPALRGTREQLATSLKTGRLGAIGAATRSRLARGLLVTQMGLAVLLAVGAGLLLRTIDNLKRVETGFDPAHLLVFRADPTVAGYDTEGLRQLYGRMLERLRVVPGVESASLSLCGLVSGDVWLTDLTVPGFEGTVDLGFSFPADGPLAFVQAVDPAFFETVRLPLRLGRPVTEADASGAPRVVVVNETLARTYFPDRNPIGAAFRIGGDDDAPEVTIVGVVADMPFDSLRRDVPPTFFGSYLQEPDLEGVTFEVRTTTPPLDLAPAVRAAVREIDPRLPLDGLMTEEQQIADSYREERVYATLAVTIGAVGLLLAAVGLYGLLAYQVAQRTQELGLRMALGATRGRLARLVLVQSFRLATVGAVLGLAVSLAATRALGDILFGLTATDPATLAGAIVALLAVAALAGYLPARHAARVDPLVALRTE